MEDAGRGAQGDAVRLGSGGWGHLASCAPPPPPDLSLPTKNICWGPGMLGDEAQAWFPFTATSPRTQAQKATSPTPHCPPLCPNPPWPPPLPHPLLGLPAVSLLWGSQGCAVCAPWMGTGLGSRPGKGNGVCLVWGGPKPGSLVPAPSRCPLDCVSCLQ